MHQRNVCKHPTREQPRWPETVSPFPLQSPTVPQGCGRLLVNTPHPGMFHEFCQKDIFTKRFHYFYVTYIGHF